MELLGDSLEAIRARMHRLRVSTVACIGLQAVSLLESLHSQGWIHRDIKPANLMMGRGDRSCDLYLIDFGLAKKHIQMNKVSEERPRAEFRGTNMYASLGVHLELDQGRKDDLWSLFLVLVDLTLGDLLCVDGLFFA
eukprot:GHVN01090336.1.p1 GENE.GHVN01090336.1~~GHVN01090336.1.p1  ORF type:complete len:137 (+),score=21.54 GHVN01090336.1:156-566(+)